MSTMKKLLESIDALEGPMGMPPSLPAPEMDKGNPVTMSVSLNASGKDHVADLLDMMKNAGMSAAEPVSAKMLSPRMDMERLASIVGEPQDEPEMEEVEDEIEVEGDYANEPDAQYGDMSDAIPNGNDMHKKKKSYPATAGGDNPMNTENIKATLMAALSEKKKPDADGDGVPDWADKKPGKDDNAGKKKGSKPKKGEVPPQFKKK
jgi:hypothetical protein